MFGSLRTVINTPNETSKEYEFGRRLVFHWLSRSAAIGCDRRLVQVDRNRMMVPVMDQRDIARHDPSHTSDEPINNLVAIRKASKVIGQITDKLVFYKFFTTYRSNRFEAINFGKPGSIP